VEISFVGLVNIITDSNDITECSQDDIPTTMEWACRQCMTSWWTRDVNRGMGMQKVIFW